MNRLIMIIAFFAGLIIGKVGPGADWTRTGEIDANETVCQAQAPAGFASYPITRWGELRACLYVDEADPDRYRVIKQVQL